MRAGQQCEYLATLLRTNSDAVGNGMTQQLIHRPLIDGIQGEIAVLGITLQQPLTASPPTLANLTDRNQHFCLPRYQCQFQRERTHHYLRLSTRFS